MMHSIARAFIKAIGPYVKKAVIQSERQFHICKALRKHRFGKHGQEGHPYFLDCCRKTCALGVEHCHKKPKCQLAPTVCCKCPPRYKCCSKMATIRKYAKKTKYDYPFPDPEREYHFVYPARDHTELDWLKFHRRSNV